MYVYHFPLSDLGYLLCVRHDNTHAHLQLVLLQVEVQQGDLHIGELGGHRLTRSRAESVCHHRQGWGKFRQYFLLLIVVVTMGSDIAVVIRIVIVVETGCLAKVLVVVVIVIIALVGGGVREVVVVIVIFEK